MHVRPVTPLDRAREFNVNEMFFSTTDARGVIVSGNDVFTRVSGFAEDELIGSAHNIIRHPDMPRVAFQLLWETLKAGQPFSAYVKNMAKDGAFYWVFAVIAPLADGRLLSIRFKPTSPTLAVVEQLYARLTAAEREVLAQEGTPQQAMERSRALLETELRQLGFPHYEAFSHVSLNAELKQRDERLAALGLTLFPERLPGVAGQRAMLYSDSQSVYREVTGLFRDLHAFVSFHRKLQDAGRAVGGVAEDFRMHSLNVNITAQRHGLDGRTVGVVASFLDRYAQELGLGTRELGQHITRTSAATESINADVAIARLQMEMVLVFQAELAQGTGDLRAKLAMFTDLQDAFVTRTRAAAGAIAELQTESNLLASSRDLLSKVAMSIQLAQVRGLTEAARIEGAENLRAMFADFRRKIDETNRQLTALDDAISHLGTLTAHTPRQIHAVGDAAEAI
ncbi:MAG TPA: PAS domain-containing protein, partial [Acidobacteriota bacterium]|nr:PAS domain-containing protein [Acidobacteriota bacterium]